MVLEGLLVSLGIGFLGILFAIYLAYYVLKQNPGSETMQKISGYIHEGAMAFLKREYSYIGIFILVMFFLIIFGINLASAVVFVFGASCSLVAGFFGMKISTRANTRTAQGATIGFKQAIKVAFPGGAVMGMTVVSLGLFALTLAYYLLVKYFGVSFFGAPQILTSFSMGASSVALFARVGGGIYTKAADVGADLVGKIEKNIPEDDPRNPAVIADLVGDNVGDVAGMGADLYESYVGALVSGLVIALSAFALAEDQSRGIIYIFLLAAVGIISSLIGVFFVRPGKKIDPQKALRMGTFSSMILMAIGAFFLTKYLYGNLNFFWAAMAGLISGLIVGLIAEIYTSGKSVQKIAESSQTGAATTIISGMAISMFSVIVPMVGIGVAILLAYYFGGIFGIAVAAVGMLATAGMTISVDAYGPIADNAGGIAQMSHLGREVRAITDSLDAAGNTTAAVAKGFAIGSAALTALALFFAYAHTAKLSLIDILNAKVVAGLLIGCSIPYYFASATMEAVGSTAFKVVEEVRRQFREIAGLMEGSARADYAKCVDITTSAALQKMIVPGVTAVTVPILVGIFLGKEALGGFLAGALVTGVPMAIQLANAGGAWDNAKKYIEAGNLGGKGTATHAAAVIGDTVGDPFKDTAGPAMNILIKLMTVVSLVFAPFLVKINQGFYEFVKGLLVK